MVHVPRLSRTALTGESRSRRFAGPVQRRALRFESLESRQLLAREGLVGVDFDIVGGAKPTNWAQYIGSSNPATFLNLSDESGGATEIDFTISGGAFGFSTAPLAIPAAQIPTHVPGLAPLGGNITTASSAVSITWSGLSREATYLVYVFGLSNAAASTNVTIQGASGESFQQAVSANQLAINAELGSNQRTLDSYGIAMQPSSAGQIELTLNEVSGNIPLAGVALQAFDPDDQISEAIDPLSSTFPYSGNLDAFDVDMIRLPATAGERLLIDLDRPGGSGLDSVLRLFDDQGTQIAFSDDTSAPGEPFTSDSYLDFTFPATGTYYLGVSGFSNSAYDPLGGTGDVAGSTGAYQIFIDSVDPDDQLGEATTLFLSASVDGTLENGRDVDLYKFNLTAGERVAIDLDNVGGGASDTILRLFNSAGSQIAFSDDGPGPGESPLTVEAFLDYPASLTGLYYLGVSAFPNSAYDSISGHNDSPGTSQQYRLLVTIVDPSDPDDQMIEAFPSPPNSIYSDSISTTTDVDLLSIPVTAGQRVTIDLDRPTGSLDAILRLFDNAGNQLALSDDAAAPGEAYSIEPYLDYTFAESGTYFLGISGYDNRTYNPTDGYGDAPFSGTGDYRVQIALIDPSDPDDQIAEAHSVTVGTATHDTLDIVSDVDMYAVTVVAGQMISFDIDRPTSGPFVDSIIRLFDGQGVQIGYSDDNAAPGEVFSTESYLSYTFATGGTYFLGVSVFSNSTYDPFTGADPEAGLSTGDYSLVIRWECGLLGDANGDGSVGAADYAIWAAQFGQSGGGLSADFDGNGSVGAGDYALWAANFGKVCGPMMSAPSAPAPPSASLATSALATPALAASPSSVSPSSASPSSASPSSAGPTEPQRDPVAARPARNHRAALDRIFADLARNRHALR